MFWSADSCCANRDGYATSGPAARHLLSPSVAGSVARHVGREKNQKQKTKTKKPHNKQQALQEVHPCIPKLTWNVMLIPNPHAGFPHRVHRSVILERVSRTGKQTDGGRHTPAGSTTSQTNGHVDLSTARIGKALFISPHMQVDVPQTASTPPAPPHHPGLFGL